MRRVLALVTGSVLVVAPGAARAESAYEAARATGNLLADDDLFVDRGWYSAPLDGGALGVSTRFLLARADTSAGSELRWQAELVVQIPYERFFGRRPRVPPLSFGAPIAHEEVDMDSKSKHMKRKAGWTAVASALAVAPVASGKDKIEKLAVVPIPSTSPSTSASPSSSASAPPSTPPTALSPTAMRALIAAALRTAGLDRDDLLDGLATRARLSALAPEVRLRAFRGIDAGARVYRTDDLADRWTGSDGTSTLFEGRLSWRLDRLVFADEEVAIERIRVERSELKQRLTGRVLELALRWQRARRAVADPDALPHDRDEAAAIAIESLVALDALTGGAASSILFTPPL